jgi:flagellar basal body-associated protein FliL
MSEFNPMSEAPEEKKDNKKVIIIAVVAVVLLCCCCLVAVGFWQGDNILQALGI